MLWLCFRLPICLFGHQGHVRYLQESKGYLFYFHATSKNEIHICSNKHETDLVQLSMIHYSSHRLSKFGQIEQETVEGPVPILIHGVTLLKERTSCDRYGVLLKIAKTQSY